MYIKHFIFLTLISSILFSGCLWRHHGKHRRIHIQVQAPILITPLLDHRA